jgi:hypothetical protein
MPHSFPGKYSGDSAENRSLETYCGLVSDGTIIGSPQLCSFVILKVRVENSTTDSLHWFGFGSVYSSV